MTDKISYTGKYIIQVKDKTTGQIKQEIVLNRIMNSILNELSESLAGTTPDLEIAYLALGTDGTAITDMDTKLGSEIFRTQPTSGPMRTQTGQIETEFVVLDIEAVASIREIGIFAGSTATASADTGTLLSRILWSKEKTINEEIDFKRIDKIVRG